MTTDQKPTRQNQPQNDIDLRKIFFLMLGHWYLFVIGLALAGAGAFIYLRYKLPVYRTTATVLIEEGKNQIPSGTAQILEGIGLQPGTRNLDNQILILGSYTMIEKTLDELPYDVDYYYKGRILSTSCYPKNPIRIIPDTTTTMPFDTEFLFNYTEGKKFRLRVEDNKLDTMVAFGQLIQYNQSTFGVFLDPQHWKLLANGQEIGFKFYNREELIEDYRKRLKVEAASKDGTIVRLTLEGINKEKDKDFLNKLTEKFLESNLDKKNLEATRMIDFIDKQLIGISDSLMITENRLQEFRSQHRVMDISAQGNQIIEQAVKLEDEKARLMLESNYFDYLNRYLSSENTQETPIAPATMGIADPLLAQLVQELSQLQGEYYSGGIGEKNPFQAQLVQKINRTRESLQETLKNIIQANAIAKKENQEQIRTLNTQAAGLPVTERKLLGIEREFKLNDVMYTFLLQKRAEAQIQKASNTPDNELVDRAIFQRKPVSPKANLIYMIAVFLGISIPLILLMIKEYFNNKVTSEDELKLLTNLPISGHIPHSDSEFQTIVINEPNSNVAEAYRNLRTRMQFFIKETKSPLILVTSSMPGEGKTFTAINLASAYSLMGKKTVLVGFDLRRPKLYKDFALNNDRGVSTYLIGKDSLKDITQATNFPNLFLITAGPVPPNPAELASSDKLEGLIKNLKDQYEFIVVDSAPIGSVSDSYSIAGLADSTILIVRHGKTLKTLLESTLAEANANEIKGLSLLVNDMDIRNLSYRYAYSYGYGYNFEK